MKDQQTVKLYEMSGSVYRVTIHHGIIITEIYDKVTQKYHKTSSVPDIFWKGKEIK